MVRSDKNHEQKMQNLKFILIIFGLTILISCSREPNEKSQAVNPIIGDISFRETHGYSPTKETNENLRLQTHLKYVEQLLRDKDVSSLTKEQKENRVKTLDLLDEYWKAAAFPKNYDYPDRRVPCFIDKDGNICAVGYLIEQTAGRQVAEGINAKFKYEYLLAMNDPNIDSWIQSHGLTKEECALIQPTYGPTPSDSYISPTYGVSSFLLTGLNISLNIINGIQISKGTNDKTVPIWGLVSGLAQLGMGAYSYPKEEMKIYGLYANQGQRNVSLMNIGLGTSTIILSTWNLVANKKPKAKPLSWNIYSFPMQDQQMGVGFSLTKRL